MALLGTVPTAARAASFDDAKVGYTVGASLVINLGRDDDRSRFGGALDAGYQLFWQDSPYYTDTPYRVAPLVTAAAHVGWTSPVAWSEVTLSAGPMYPRQVGDGGFSPLVGAQVGAGLGLATDGWAGALATGGLLLPMTEARFETGFAPKGLHAPRITVGPSLVLNCCSYFL